MTTNVYSALLLYLSFLNGLLVFADFEPELHKNWKLLPPQNKCGISTEQRIIGGYVADLGSFPWIARIAYSRLIRLPHPNYVSGRIVSKKISDKFIAFSCGGSLISKYYVVTAAHCTTEPSQILYARLGEWNADTDPDCYKGVCAPNVQDIDIVDVIRNEDYSNDANMKNDIALLRLEHPPELSPFVQPVCLPPGAAMFRDFTGEDTVVAGWGLTEDNNPSTLLLAVQQKVYDSDKCTQEYADNGIDVNYDDGQMCVGGRVGKDSCNGDSGGPLIWTGSFDTSVSARSYLLGIVSLGPASCGVFEIPGVYSRTTYFLEWILDNLQE